MAELFPQHCREPTYSPESHARELAAELQENMVTVGRKGRTVRVLKMLARHLNAFFNGTPPPNPEQRVDEHTKQRVNDCGNQIPIPDIQRVSNAPPTMVANNLTSKMNPPSQHKNLPMHNTEEHTRSTPTNCVPCHCTTPYTIPCPAHH